MLGESDYRLGQTVPKTVTGKNGWGLNSLTLRQKRQTLSNLQPLLAADNIRKSKPLAEVTTFVCPECGVIITKWAKHVRHNLKQGKAGPFCGKRCARAWQYRTTGR